MKLSMSHIAWQPEEEQQALALLQQYGFAGVEIAPPRIAGQTPYQFPQKASEYAHMVRQSFNLAVCSMQSIWFGQSGSMFGAERSHFIDYTKAAIRFAQSCGAGNLVFGNPKNRVLPQGASPQDAVLFFKEIGDYAAQHNTVIGLEANPPLYGTNFMNATTDALAMAAGVDSPGCRLTLDFGTIIINDEPISQLQGKIGLVNHVHISEPELVAIEPRAKHRELALLLQQEGYTGYVSVEMKSQPMEVVEQTANYLAEVFA